MRHEGANILHGDVAQALESHPTAEMHSKKVQELPNIALIGIDGLLRHPPLGAEMGEPMADFGGDFGRRERQVGGGIGSRIFGFAHGRTEILFQS
jgi:hypothetical protein